MQVHSLANASKADFLQICSERGQYRKVKEIGSCSSWGRLWQLQSLRCCTASSFTPWDGRPGGSSSSGDRSSQGGAPSSLGRPITAEASDGAVLEQPPDALPGPPGISPHAREFSREATARIVAVVGKGSVSPFDEAPWEDVMRHMAQRIYWIDPGLEMLVFTDDAATSDPPQSEGPLAAAVAQADVFLAIEVQSELAVPPVAALMRQVGTSVSLGSHPELAAWTRLGGLAVGQLSAPERAAADLGVWPKASKSFKVMKMVAEAWERRNPDDVWFAVLVLVNAFVRDVAALQSLRATDLASVQCMLSNCGPQIWACLAEPSCRAALQCLTSCGPTDQVCSYRCIVSYESAELEAFSLCTLQKHNCLNLSAEIRMRPEISPMASFRGDALSHALAEDLLVGWLGKKEYSWRVVAGQNAAYDQFPCQYQIFYRGKARGSVWYDPVFTVRTLTGQATWRRRHYRVRRAEQPGTFWFSVLDNGVISKEYWRIVDVDEAFAWALFYYSGAAAAAGQSYTGAVLLSQDGNWPAPEHQERMEAALAKCGIKPWELFRVDNSQCTGAPLDMPVDAPPAVSIA